ncbi:hypothetical protein [Mizugakiibacter sediminis]|uniref:hypothetical protein n=1 Tax=Mizugakiibacter sediminis TaxID=1475481 RepID=UPI0011E4D32A|nr:hypothetical protein [Mizugakiibacter sediminis]
MAHSARLASVVIATLLLVLASISPAAAQSVSGADELRQLVPRDDARHVADDDLFGGRFDPYTGAVEFTQTDASLAGSSALPVQITRTFRVGDPRPISRTSAGEFNNELRHA